MTNQTKRDSLACFLHITPLLEKLFVKVRISPEITHKLEQFHDHEPIYFSVLVKVFGGDSENVLIFSYCVLKIFEPTQIIDLNYICAD